MENIRKELKKHLDKKGNVKKCSDEIKDILSKYNLNQNEKELLITDILKMFPHKTVSDTICSNIDDVIEDNIEGIISLYNFLVGKGYDEDNWFEYGAGDRECCYIKGYNVVLSL